MGKKKRPTIAELEAILDDPKSGPVTILPNGEITVDEGSMGDREKLKQKILDRWSGQTVFAVADDLSDYILQLRAEHYARSKALRDALQRTLNLLGDIGQMDTPDFPVYQDACKLIAAHDADEPPEVWKEMQEELESLREENELWQKIFHDVKDCPDCWKTYKEASGG